MGSLRLLPPVSPKAWQRTIREQHEEHDPRPPLDSIEGCRVEPITREEAKPFILRYEWLGTMGVSNAATYGMRSPSGELIGVSCFGWPGSVQSRDICGKDNRDLAVCLERGACSHIAPPNAASFLIAKTVKMAAAEHNWKIFYAYADPEAGEIGTVYQACNWLYIGQGMGRRPVGRPPDDSWMIPEENNKIISSRTLRDRKVTPNRAREMGWIPIPRHAKHKYIHLEGTRVERRRLMSQLRYPIQPYPKR